MNRKNQIQDAVEFIHSKIQFTPDLAIVLGSGLGGLADKIHEPIYIPYADVPHFPVSTAPGHAGRFVAGKLGNKKVLAMQGRFHYYEGYDMSTIALPVQVLKALGTQALVLTNAAGGINLDFTVGDFMLIKDHINLMGNNPLRGRNDETIGPRFFDMSHVYDKDFQQIARDCAKALDIDLKEGVYVGFMGPSYETPAEINAFRLLGGDAVGMSTVPEVIAAAHCGLPVLAMSLITNMAAGIKDETLSGDDVVETARQKGEVFERLVISIVNAMHF